MYIIRVLVEEGVIQSTHGPDSKTSPQPLHSVSLLVLVSVLSSSYRVDEIDKLVAPVRINGLAPQ